MTQNTTTTKARHFALIPAGGVGTRMEATTPKQYIPIAGKPMISHVLETFADTAHIAHTYVVVSTEDSTIDALIDRDTQLTGKVTVLRCGGNTRAQTVHNGLCAIAHLVDDNDWILVHDAARPGITTALLDKLMQTLADDMIGGLLALPVVDTLKQATDGRADKTIPRAHLWAAQTPQMFRYALLKKALEQAQTTIGALTDDASAIEQLGFAPKLVEGSPRNFKVTLPHDIALAEFLLLQDKG